MLMLQKLAVAVILMPLLAGCFTPQSLSQGSVPCRQDEMRIVDKKTTLPAVGAPSSWTVICHEKRYYCAARYGQYSAPAVNCVQVDE